MMGFYHSKVPKHVGGRKGRLMRRVVGVRWEEMLDLAGDFPSKTVINRPPLGVDSWKSKSLPTLRVDEEAVGQIGSNPVSDDHILVLTWLIRRDLYARRHTMTDEITRFFEKGIQGSLSELIKKGHWIDHPENESLETLNQVLEKIDLGRRSYLKRQSDQSYLDEHGFSRHDRDVQRPDKEDPSEIQYRQSPPHVRAKLREERPWMAAKWIADYGE